MFKQFDVVNILKEGYEGETGEVIKVDSSETYGVTYLVKLDVDGETVWLSGKDMKGLNNG